MSWWESSDNEELKRSTVILIRSILLVDPKVRAHKLMKSVHIHVDVDVVDVGDVDDVVVVADVEMFVESMQNV